MAGLRGMVDYGKAGSERSIVGSMAGQSGSHHRKKSVIVKYKMCTDAIK